MVGLAIAVAAGCGIIVGLGVVLRDSFPTEIRLAAVGAIPMVGGAISIWAWRDRRPAFSTMAFGIAAVAFALSLHAIASHSISRHQQYGQLLSLSQGDRQERLACLGRLEPTWVFYFGKPIKHFGSHNPADAEEFLSASPHHRLIVTRSELSGHGLDSRVDVIRKCDYFLRDEELLLVRSAKFVAGN